MYDVAKVTGRLKEVVRLWYPWRAREGCLLRKAIFLVYGIPDIPSCVAGESFWIVHETYIVTFSRCALVFWYTIIPVITLVIVFYHTTLPYVLSQYSLQRPLIASFFLQLPVGMCGFRPFQFTQLLCSPYHWYSLLILQRIHFTSYITTRSRLIIPRLDRTFLIIKIESVVGEEIRRLCYRF